MDQRSAIDKDTEFDLESGLPVIEDDLKKDSSPCSAKQGKTLFDKVSGMFAGNHIKGDDRPSLYRKESNLSGVSNVDAEVTSKSLVGKGSIDCVAKTPVKEKRKKASNKKAPKPPRPPRSPSLDAADHKLIREISELTMLKRARIERMKALKKMQAAKSSSSSSSSVLSMVFTIIFCIVIILQGMSSGKTSVASFQGSPVSATGTVSGMITVQNYLHPSASDPNAPNSESHNFVQPITTSYLPGKHGRDVG